MSHQSSQQDFAVMSAAEGTHSDASSVPRATRNQLDHFFETLSKEKRIAIEQNGEGCNVVCESDGERIGFCYYTVSVQNAKRYQ